MCSANQTGCMKQNYSGIQGFWLGALELWLLPAPHLVSCLLHPCKCLLLLLSAHWLSPVCSWLLTLQEAWLLTLDSMRFSVQAPVIIWLTHLLLCSSSTFFRQGIWSSLILVFMGSGNNSTLGPVSRGRLWSWWREGHAVNRAFMDWPGVCCPLICVGLWAALVASSLNCTLTFLAASCHLYSQILNIFSLYSFIKYLLTITRVREWWLRRTDS